ncbi:MAG: flavin-containing monooxygenase [Gammaproteobacteria bacterium]
MASQAFDLDNPQDIDKLHQRYQQERDKRIKMRPEGNEQYSPLTGNSHYLTDPYITQPMVREPLSDEVEVAIIGGGFGGLLAGAKLRKAGIENLRIIEKGGDFGGTWYWNRYPGAACDIESFIYMPLLEETGYMPTEKYARAEEILDYARLLARHYNLYQNSCLQTEVNGLNWNAELGRWIVKTDRGDRIKARFVIVSNGVLHVPKLPKIANLEQFAGKHFHTSRWDYNYTGGDINGNLHRLKDKTVGIIGTGATAVQSVPHLSEWAKELYVFQRTPSSIDYRQDSPTDQAWAQSLQPGWQQHRMENFNNLVSGLPEQEDLINDGWTDILHNLIFRFTQQRENSNQQSITELMQLADFEKMESIRSRVDELVKDPQIAEKLKPWYNQFCKRPCFHNAYLQSFNRANTHLIDTDGAGVERIEANSVIANGKEYQLDCLIFATGFVVGSNLTGNQPSYNIEGAHGQTLAESWEQKGISSLYGIQVRDFPNLFLLGSVQGGFTANFPHNLAEQSDHCAYIIESMRSNQQSQVQPSEQAEANWVRTIEEKALLREEFLKNCTPGYYNNEGLTHLRTRRQTTYGGGSPEYFSILQAWRKDGRKQGLEFK